MKGNGRFRNWPSRIVWAVVAIPAVWIMVAGIPFRYTQLLGQNIWFQNEQGLQTAPEQAALIVLLLEIIVGLVFFTCGAFFAWFKSNSRLGILLAFEFLALAAILPAMTNAAIVSSTPWQNWTWFVHGLRALASTTAILAFYWLPDGRFSPNWTKYLGYFWILLNIGWLLFPQMPFNTVNGVTYRATETASNLFIAAWFLSGIIAQISRYRATTDSMTRQQIKWVAFGIVLAGVGGLAYLFLHMLYPVLKINSDLYVIGRTAVSSIFLLGLPICIAIAIFRYRLFDIEIIIRKTLQYLALTLLLGLIYFGTVILLQNIIGQVIGEQSPIIIVLSTLLIAALFNPLRQRVQAFVDRRFYRQKYDAQQVLAQFAQTARNEVDLQTLTAELTHLINETMQPENVAVWFSEGGK